MLSRLADLPLISGATQKANSDYKGRWLGVYSPDVPSNRRSPLVQPSYSPVLELSSHSRCANLSRRILRGRRMLPQKRHERRMVVGVNDTSVSLTRVVTLFVRHDGDNVRVGTVVVKILCQCTSSRLVELIELRPRGSGRRRFFARGKDKRQQLACEGQCLRIAIDAVVGVCQRSYCC
jgi:hypothetical protein